MKSRFGSVCSGKKNESCALLYIKKKSLHKFLWKYCGILWKFTSLGKILSTKGNIFGGICVNKKSLVLFCLVALSFASTFWKCKMSEVKQRKKGISSSKTSEDSQKLEKHSNHGKLAGPRMSNNQSSFWIDLRTALNVISLAACLVLTW